MITTSTTSSSSSMRPESSQKDRHIQGGHDYVDPQQNRRARRRILKKAMMYYSTKTKSWNSRIFYYRNKYVFHPSSSKTNNRSNKPNEAENEQAHAPHERRLAPLLSSTSRSSSTSLLLSSLLHYKIKDKDHSKNSKIGKGDFVTKNLTGKIRIPQHHKNEKKTTSARSCSATTTKKSTKTRRKALSSSTLITSLLVLLHLASSSTPAFGFIIQENLIQSINTDAFPVCECADCCIGALIPAESSFTGKSQMECRYHWQGSPTCMFEDNAFCTPAPETLKTMGPTRKMDTPLTLEQFCSEGCQAIPDDKGNFKAHNQRMWNATSGSGTAAVYLPDTRCEKTSWLNPVYEKNPKPLLPEPGPGALARFIRYFYNTK
ncbi:unnamed protein product [Amoebophrya sp. A25]|nr:unnamed protein product [Amoebophrya sp. A25]|eukprot:GSA25T00007396001.1